MFLAYPLAGLMSFLPSARAKHAFSLLVGLWCVRACVMVSLGVSPCRREADHTRIQITHSPQYPPLLTHSTHKTNENNPQQVRPRDFREPVDPLLPHLPRLLRHRGPRPAQAHRDAGRGFMMYMYIYVYVWVHVTASSLHKRHTRTPKHTTPTTGVPVHHDLYVAFPPLPPLRGTRIYEYIYVCICVYGCMNM